MLGIGNAASACLTSIDSESYKSALCSLLPIFYTLLIATAINISTL